jgi:PilZ domain
MAGERRRARRSPIRVQMEGKKNGDVFTGTSVNLSETGILIETAKHLDIGQEVTVHLILPGDDEVTGRGVVVRLEDRGIDKFGLAVHWELSTEQRITLARLIQETSR